MSEKKNALYIGSMWRKGKTKTGPHQGEPFLSGNIRIPLDIVKAKMQSGDWMGKYNDKSQLEISFLCFKNHKKEEGSKQPDYQFVVFEDNDQKEKEEDEAPW